MLLGDEDDIYKDIIIIIINKTHIIKKNMHVLFIAYLCVRFLLSVHHIVISSES